MGKHSARSTMTDTRACLWTMRDLTEREAFVKGFTLGAKIIIEVLESGGDE